MGMSTYSAKLLADNASKPTFFNSAELVMLQLIGAHTIPETQTPGALQASCHVTVSRILEFTYPPAFASETRSLLKSLENNSLQTTGMPFELATEESQLALLTSLDRGDAPFDQIQMKAFRELKQLFVFAYCTSEQGALNELVYLAVPGPYLGSIPYEQVGAAYSSKAYY